MNPTEEKSPSRGILASLDGANPAQGASLSRRLAARWQPYRGRLALRRSRVVLLFLAAALPAIFWMARGPGKPVAGHDAVFAAAPAMVPLPDGKAEEMAAAIVNEPLAVPVPRAEAAPPTAHATANQRPLVRKPVPRRTAREPAPPDSDVALLAALVAHDNAAAAALSKALPAQEPRCGNPRGERTRACACAQNDASCLPQ
ncbi:hypothetical protein [Massilia endophytica]|uniref:hypothetical protein n=1 Tax=Massilia endophytica TaxID=2899220 RepID=UPI001E31049E|nr:hypothetical protein [Massilia endophytica]UGQ44839.1 hypothetical protein LSQ66_13620 [Massilia endophytica]